MANKPARRFSSTAGLEYHETDHNSTANKFNSGALFEMQNLQKQINALDEQAQPNNQNGQKRFSKQATLLRKKTVEQDESEHMHFENQKEREHYYRVKIAENKHKSDKPITGLPRHIEGKDSEDEVLLLKRDLKRIDTAAAVVSFIGLVLAFIENEYFFNNGNVSEIVNDILRSFVLVTGIIVSILLYNHYRIRLLILRCRKIIYNSTSVFGSQFLKNFLFEVFLALIHCPPGVDSTITNYELGYTFIVSIDAYIFALMFNRIYLLLRLFNHYTFWTGPRSSRICKMNGVDADTSFAVKAYLRYKATIFLLIGFAFSIFYFGLLVRTFERPFMGGPSRYHFNNIWNSFWCVFISMATIGYGEIYPVTQLGRATMVAAVLWGTFVLSLLVVALNTLAGMSPGESSVYDELNTQGQVKKKLAPHAAVFVQLWWRHKMMLRKRAQLKEQFQMKTDVFLACKKFKTMRKALTHDSKSSTELIEGIHKKEEQELEELLIIMVPLQDIANHINSSNEVQDKINFKSLKLLENSKKIHNLMLMLNRGERPQASRLEDVKILYDNRNLPINPKAQRNYAKEFQDIKEDISRVQETSQEPQPSQPKSPVQNTTNVNNRGTKNTPDLSNKATPNKNIYPNGMDNRNLMQISKQVPGNAEEIQLATATNRFSNRTYLQIPGTDYNHESNGLHYGGNSQQQYYNQAQPQEPYTANMGQGDGIQSQGFSQYVHVLNQNQRGYFDPVPYPNLGHQNAANDSDGHLISPRKMLPSQVHY